MNKTLIILSTLTTLLTISGVYLAVAPSEQNNLQQSAMSQLRQEYEEWKTKYNKNTNSHDEYRFSVWVETYEEVSKHNKRTDATYTKSMNKFSDLTTQEFQEKYLMENQQKSSKQSLKSGDVQRNEQQFFKGQQNFQKISQPVQNQASCGSCYSFAAAQAIESAYALQTDQKNLKLSEQQIVSCSQPYGNNGCGGGFGFATFDYVIANGLDTEEQVPYTSGEEGVVPKCPVKKGEYFISSYNHITGLGNCLNQQLAALQQPLYARAYASDWKQYEKGIYNDCPKVSDPETINHGIGIVGFNTEHENESENYWIIRNSWGPDWGENGYMKLAFGDSCSICNDAYQVFV